jgi:hypothetical protein
MYPAEDELVATIDNDVTISKTILGENGSPISLPSCYFVLCDENQRLIDAITPYISGGSFAVTIPRIHTLRERTLYWSLRATANANTNFDHGRIRFDYAASETAPQGPVSTTYVPRWGVPAGGIAGQFLEKVDSVDFKTRWSSVINSSGSFLAYLQSLPSTLPTTPNMPWWDNDVLKRSSVSVVPSLFVIQSGIWVDTGNWIDSENWSDI